MVLNGYLCSVVLPWEKSFEYGLHLQILFMDIGIYLDLDMDNITSYTRKDFFFNLPLK